MQPIGFAPDERSLVVHHVTRGRVTQQMSLWSNVMQPGIQPHFPKKKQGDLGCYFY